MELNARRSLRVVSLVLALSLVVSCRFDPRASVGATDGGRDRGSWLDASWWDGARDVHSLPDALVDRRAFDAAVDAGLMDAAVDAAPGCTNGTFQCISGWRARTCSNGTWSLPKRCFLGCVEAIRECREPSNVDTDTLGFQESQLGDISVDDNLTVDTDSGHIQAQSGTEIRRGDRINSVDNGIGFYRVSVAGHELGVFVLASWTIPAGRTVTVTGGPAFVALVSQDATILGRIDAGAHGQDGGPGGFDGGAPGQPGLGPCPGHPGSGSDTCDKLCASGSGGGGFGGAGGTGGSVDCHDLQLAGGAGGNVCGNEELSPLVGGSGGAGGSLVENHTYDATNGDPGPGPGGGGGGAVQISVRGRLVLGSGGGILVPGDGGGETTSGGGAGGGAGGAILVEAGTVVADTGAFLAANGGGGGAGDCT